MELTSAAAPCSWAKRKHRDVSRCRGVNAAHRAWERQRFAPATPSESAGAQRPGQNPKGATGVDAGRVRGVATRVRSEEHTSELQSRLHLVCRLLLEKNKHDNS